MADLYLTPAERYTAALGGFYYGDLPEPGTVYTQLIKDILDGSTPDKEPKNILARFIYSLYISDLGDPYPRYELAKLLYWKLHNITPTKSGSVLTVTIDGKEDYMTINTDLSRLWYKVLFGSKTDIITEFPYIFNTMQNKLSDWGLFGNTVQSGTPSPDSPVMPQGTGERTGNLVFVSVDNETHFSNYNQYTISDGTITVTGRMLIGFKVKITPDTTYTVSAVYRAGVLMRVRQYTEIPNDWVNGFINQPVNTNLASATFTTSSEAEWILVVFYSEVVGETINSIMLNLGSTPLPYEKYGIKIPISSAGQTTPVYLGEVETTRRIKKLVLTGEENITSGHTDVGLFNIPVTDYLKIADVVTNICSHYMAGINVNGWPDVTDMTSRFYGNAGSPSKLLYIRDSSYTTVADFKTYLQQQYAAGTPVTVWYVLATEETGIVNEPLMKIGDYADCISRAQTGIDIPTVIGQNTLDVLTTVKPSSMSIEYTSADENRSRSKRISLLKSPLKKRLIK